MRNELGSIDDLGGGRWRVQVSAGYDRKTGHRIRPSKVVRSKAEAKKELRLMLMRTGQLQPRKLTVTEYMEDVWLPTKEGTVRADTFSGYKEKVRTCINPYIGNLQLAALDTYVVEQWMANLAKDGKGPQTIRLARGVLKNGMKAAVRWNQITRDPTEGTPLPESRYKPEILSGDAMKAYLEAFQGHVIEPIVIVAIAAGLRRSEACALLWSDIDFETGYADITKVLLEKDGRVWIDDTKTEASSRAILLPPWALQRLKELRGVGPLVPDILGQCKGHMDPNRVSSLYRSHIDASGLTYVPLRNLRNSHGTLLFDSGVDLALIADRLGHTNTVITRKHYVERKHVRAEKVSAAAIASILVGQNGPTSGGDVVQSIHDAVSESQKAGNE